MGPTGGATGQVGSDPHGVFYNTSVGSGNGERREEAHGDPWAWGRDENQVFVPGTETELPSLLFSSNLALLCYISGM
jgi:hypothetical protein